MNINNWEDNEIIRNFNNIQNITQEHYDIVIDAYYFRDQNMNINIDNVFNQIVSKLRLSPELIRRDIILKFRNEMYNRIDNLLNNPNVEIIINNNYLQNYINENLNSNDNQDKLEKYNYLRDHYNLREHKQLYQCLSINDLIYLGW